MSRLDQILSWTAPALVALALFLPMACGKSLPSGSAEGANRNVENVGSLEVIARLIEVPDGAIFERDLYDYATILKYEVMSVERGGLSKGDIIYIAHYNPWKPRADAHDDRAKEVGGTLRIFRAGDLHHLALEVPIDDHYMGGVVDKYFGTHSGPVYWAVWTEKAK